MKTLKFPLLAVVLAVSACGSPPASTEVSLNGETEAAAASEAFPAGWGLDWDEYSPDELASASFALEGDPPPVPPECVPWCEKLRGCEIQVLGYSRETQEGCEDRCRKAKNVLREDVFSDTMICVQNVSCNALPSPEKSCRAQVTGDQYDAAYRYIVAEGERCHPGMHIMGEAICAKALECTTITMEGCHNYGMSRFGTYFGCQKDELMQPFVDCIAVQVCDPQLRYPGICLNEVGWPTGPR